MNEFVRLGLRQLAADVRSLPGATRRHFSAQGRVDRCVNIADLRKVARRKIPRAVFDYLDGAAWDEVTARRNQSDFAQLTIKPRVLVDVGEVDTSTTVLGQPVSIPIVGAPTGLTGLMHHRGELAIAQALHAAGSINTLSTAASYSIEDIATQAPGPAWFQLYVPRDHGLARELLARARDAGYLALVLTVDLPISGIRERDLRNSFARPPRITLRSCLSALARPRWSVAFVRDPRMTLANLAPRFEASDAATAAASLGERFDSSVTWSDLEWMREVWSAPLLLKGVLRPEDARTAVDLGVSGIIVSNHGGRQLDHAPSAIQALPGVVDAVGSEVDVILDGGVRRGTDILKALALGARACMIGRALVYGLGAGGDAGTQRAVQVLTEELRVAMALAGCPSIAAIDQSLIGSPWPEPASAPSGG